MGKAASAGMELPVESVVADRYKVVRLLARGGMAEVYVAKHIKLNREVALKLLKPPPDAEDPASFEARFALEAETLAGLDHSNIVTLHDFGETDDGRYFLAMEFIDGPRLTDLLKNGPLPFERAVRLLLQVCAALRYSHKRGVIHRDLKPSNLLIKPGDEDHEDQVKVVDFGLVKLTEADQSITRAGLILGSPHCMAPEQIKGTDVDHRADIYAIGVLLFRCITGHYPFHGSSSTATMIAHLNQPAPSFASVAGHVTVPHGLEDIIKKCLSKVPGERYSDMDTLMWDLATCVNLPQEAFGSLSLTHSSIQRRMTTEIGARRRGPSIGTGIIVASVSFSIVLLAFLLVGGGLFFAAQSSSTVGVGSGSAGVESNIISEPAPPPQAEPEPEPEPEPPAPEPEPQPEPRTAQGTADATPAPKPIAVSSPASKPPPGEPIQEEAPPPQRDNTAANHSEPKDDAPQEPEPTEGEEKAPEGYMGLPDDLF